MKHRVIVVGLIEKNECYLLGKKPENIGPYPNTWHLPGGGINLDKETLEEALIREIKEETGIEIKEIQSLGFDEDYEKDKHGEMTHYIFLDFKANYLSGEIKANDDMKKLKWVKRNELKDLNLNKPTEKLFKKLSLM
jgi:ADP-ribose pyrophosphatase YjhB (NUDIX family)